MFKLVQKKKRRKKKKHHIHMVHHILTLLEYLGRKSGIYEMLLSCYSVYHAEVHLNVVLSLKFSVNNIPH